MPKGFHYGRAQHRAYTGEYHKLYAKTCKTLLNAELGKFNYNITCYSEEHQTFELKEVNNIRYLSFIINDREHQIALKLDNRSASNKLYITCPYCQKNKQHLFAFKNGYACRSCLGLHYGCQSERPQERLMRRIRKLRVELWGADFPFVYDMFDQCKYWPKPKWMRWATFEKKRSHIVKLEERYWPLVRAQMERMNYGELGLDF